MYDSLTDAELDTLITNAKAALNDLLTGGAQSYSIKGRTVTRANVKDLRDLLKELTAEKSARAADADGFGSVVVEFVDP